MDVVKCVAHHLFKVLNFIRNIDGMNEKIKNLNSALV